MEGEDKTLGELNDNYGSNQDRSQNENQGQLPLLDLDFDWDENLFNDDVNLWDFPSDLNLDLGSSVRPEGLNQQQNQQQQQNQYTILGQGTGQMKSFHQHQPDSVQIPQSLAQSMPVSVFQSEFNQPQPLQPSNPVNSARNFGVYQDFRNQDYEMHNLEQMRPLSYTPSPSTPPRMIMPQMGGFQQRSTSPLLSQRWSTPPPSQLYPPATPLGQTSRSLVPMRRTDQRSQPYQKMPIHDQQQQGFKPLATLATSMIPTPNHLYSSSSSVDESMRLMPPPSLLRPQVRALLEPRLSGMQPYGVGMFRTPRPPRKRTKPYTSTSRRNASKRPQLVLASPLPPRFGPVSLGSSGHSVAMQLSPSQIRPEHESIPVRILPLTPSRHIRTPHPALNYNLAPELPPPPPLTESEQSQYDIWERLLEPLSLGQALHLRVACPLFSSVILRRKWRFDFVELETVLAHRLSLGEELNALEQLIKGWVPHVRHFRVNSTYPYESLPIEVAVCYKMVIQRSTLSKLELCEWPADMSALREMASGHPTNQSNHLSTLTELSLPEKYDYVKHHDYHKFVWDYIVPLLDMVRLRHLNRLSSTRFFECLTRFPVDRLAMPHLRSLASGYLAMGWNYATTFLMANPQLEELDVIWDIKPFHQKTDGELGKVDLFFKKFLHHAPNIRTLRIRLEWSIPPSEIVQITSKLDSIRYTPLRLSHLELDFRSIAPQLVHPLMSAFLSNQPQPKPLQTLVLRSSTMSQFLLQMNHLTKPKPTPVSLDNLVLDVSRITYFNPMEPEVVLPGEFHVRQLTLLGLDHPEQIPVIIGAIAPSVQSLHSLQFYANSGLGLQRLTWPLLQDMFTRNPNTLSRVVLGGTTPRVLIPDLLATMWNQSNHRPMLLYQGVDHIAEVEDGESLRQMLQQVDLGLNANFQLY